MGSLFPLLISRGTECRARHCRSVAAEVRAGPEPAGGRCQRAAEHRHGEWPAQPTEIKNPKKECALFVWADNKDPGGKTISQKIARSNTPYASRDEFLLIGNNEARAPNQFDVMLKAQKPNGSFTAEPGSPGGIHGKNDTTLFAMTQKAYDQSKVALGYLVSEEIKKAPGTHQKPSKAPARRRTGVEID